MFLDERIYFMDPAGNPPLLLSMPSPQLHIMSLCVNCKVRSNFEKLNLSYCGTWTAIIASDDDAIYHLQIVYFHLWLTLVPLWWLSKLDTGTKHLDSFLGIMPQSVLMLFLWASFPQMDNG